MKSIILSVVLMGLGGCGIGASSMLFASKTNAGLDVDSMPPTAQVSVGRSETVIAPAFERGLTPPVIASFRTGDEGLFASRVGSAFAAGGAAVAMARLWDSQAAATDPRAFDSTLVLSDKPIGPDCAEWPDKGVVRPLVFGTDTSIGLKAAWSGLGGAFPDSLRIGYHRKEAAWAPATYASSRPDGRGGREAGHFVDVPSLLATVDASVDAGAPSESRWQSVQYFATGDAATRLAMQPDVRQVMRPRFDPAAAEAAEGDGFVAPGVDQSADRLRAWVERAPENREQLRTWLDARQVPRSVTFFVNDASMRPLREEALNDPALGILVEAELSSAGM